MLENCSMFTLLGRIFIDLFCLRHVSALAILSTCVPILTICQSALIWNQDYVCVFVKKTIIAIFDTTYTFQGVLRRGSMQMI